MIVGLALSLVVAWDQLKPKFRLIKAQTHHHSSSKNEAGGKNYRLFLNGRPTSFYESVSEYAQLGIRSIERKGTKDAYLICNRTDDGGAIMSWNTTYFYWNGYRLSSVATAEGDPLEFDRRGRLLVIESLSANGTVGNMDRGWEADRESFMVWKGDVYKLGGAVNIWFEKDGSIRGISNGRNMSGAPSEKASPHFFSYRNGVRTDEPVQAGMLKRTGKRLYPLKGSASRY